MNTLRWQLGLLACLTLMAGCASVQTPMVTGTPLAVTPSPPIASPLPVATRVAPSSTPQIQSATTPTTEGAETLALVNGTLMDGTGAAPLAGAAGEAVPRGAPLVRGESMPPESIFAEWHPTRRREDLPPHIGILRRETGEATSR